MTMDMDIWYELRLREMSGLNEGVEELLRDAEEVRLLSTESAEGDEN